VRTVVLPEPAGACRTNERVGSVACSRVRVSVAARLAQAASMGLLIERFFDVVAL
jgi:hypothetical protein